MSQSPVTQYVDALSSDDRHAVIASYEQFERDGHIGDEPIRIHARQLMVHLGITDDYHVTLWMQQLAFECYRFYYAVYARPVQDDSGTFVVDLVNGDTYD